MVYCNECKRPISPKAYAWSIEKYGRALCGEHQREARLASKITPEAKTLGEILKRKGHHVQFEKWDGHKHIDIAIIESQVNIEVDGAHHNLDNKQALRDLKRTYYSFKKGFVTLRIPNCLVSSPKIIQETADFIDEFLRESKEQLEEED
jgi:very-short-patch-repair endonuclease